MVGRAARCSNGAMQRTKVLQSILLLAGLIGFGIGASIVFAPVAFHTQDGIDLAGNTSLLSEVRAPGAALMVCSLCIALGAFITELTFTSTLLGTLLYLSYGLSRLLSIALDGLPHPILVQAAVAELVIGALCMFALVKYRVPRPLSAASASHSA